MTPRREASFTKATSTFCSTPLSLKPGGRKASEGVALSQRVVQHVSLGTDILQAICQPAGVVYSVFNTV